MMFRGRQHQVSWLFFFFFLVVVVVLVSLSNVPIRDTTTTTTSQQQLHHHPYHFVYSVDAFAVVPSSSSSFHNNNNNNRRHRRRKCDRIRNSGSPNRRPMTTTDNNNNNNNKNLPVALLKQETVKNTETTSLSAPESSSRSNSSSMLVVSRSDFFHQTTIAVAAVTSLSVMTTMIFGGVDVATAATATAEAEASASSKASYSSEQRPDRSTIPSSSSSLVSSSSPKSSSSSSIQESSLSGIVAGASLAGTKTLVKYPLDTATVRIQIPTGNYSITRPFELFDGCWDGITFTLISNVPAGAVFFGVKDAVKTALVNLPVVVVAGGAGPLPKWLTTTIAVAIAQIPYWIVRNPSEVIKVRQQTSSPAAATATKTGRSAWDVIQEMMSEQNQLSTTVLNDESSSNGNSKFSLLMSQLYVGYWENVAYAFPADVLKFIIYETLKGYVAASALAASSSSSSFSPLEGAVIGASATALSQLLTTPLDVVRNRRMMTVKSSKRRNESSTKKDIIADPNYFQTIIQLGNEEGLAGLFAGAAPRVGKAILSGAIQFATYEETKTIMIQYFQNQITR